MRAKVAPLVLGLLAGLSLLLIATSCGEPDARDQSISFRDQNLALADAKFPLPILQNFPARGLLKEFTERQDLVNHPWFAYYMGENGNVVWYFVSETLPVNVCAFLSSTEDVRDDNDGNGTLIEQSHCLYNSREQTRMLRVAQIINVFVYRAITIKKHRIRHKTSQNNIPAILWREW